MSSSYYTSYTPLIPTKNNLPYNLIIPLSPIESTYSLPSWRAWFSENWTISIYISLFYSISIFLIQLYMRNKPRFELRTPLFLWNVGLAIFSLGGTLRVWPETVYILFGEGGGGWWGSCCSRDHHNVGAAFWGLLFTLSKGLELGDTFFIVLRKQPLIFLHWYHHITVLIYTWFTYHTYDATSRWFMVMNFPVHTLMYSYYALKSLRLRTLKIPRSISITITILQLSQMVLGVVINLYAWFNEGNCTVEQKHVTLALVMYGSYFVLFLRYFVGVYVGGRKTLSNKRQQQEKKVVGVVGVGELQQGVVGEDKKEK